MQRRDDEISQRADELSALKQDTTAAKIALNEQLEFLQQEETNNVEVEKLVVAAGLYSSSDFSSFLFPSYFSVRSPMMTPRRACCCQGAAGP